jgi:hypothetical protein
VYREDGDGLVGWVSTKSTGPAEGDSKLGIGFFRLDSEALDKSFQRMLGQ